LSFPGLVEPYRLPSRGPNVYKQALGHIAVVGGDANMGGAPIMAAEAALRVGAGMVTLITRGVHRPAVLARRPEIMVADADDAEERQAALQRASCLVVGPGLGTGSWGEKLLREALAQSKPTVLDADGLNLFAMRNLAATAPLIITPHTGEAARLLAQDSAGVQADRPAAALQLATRAAGVAVLKGAGTVIASQASAVGDPGSADASVGSPTLLGVCAHGNPGMASAGMGDVLSGVIAGCLAQGLEAIAAAVVGTCLHSYAADLAAVELGQRSLLATDLFPRLISALVELEESSR
jgi:NAD(P)H-hydrate epimerase